jgi:acyl-CoA synthetase (AMP-forming)/AMP-acid ligase II
MRLFGRLETFADRTALIDHDGASISYQRLLERGEAMAAPLGDARRLILFEMATSSDAIAAYVAAVRAGHVLLLTPPGGAKRDSRCWRTFGPDAAFTCAQGFEILSQPTGEPHPDLAILLSTSGSTGSPKLVRLSHANLASNAAAIIEYLKIGPDERAITSLPLAYSYGLSVLNSHLEAGASLVLTNDSIAEPSFWRSFDEHRATSFAGVPHSFDLLERSGFLLHPHPSLRYFTQAGGKMSADQVKRLAEQARDLGVRFYVMYGQTEAAPRMAYVPPEAVLDNPDAIGVPIPGGEFDIRRGPDGSDELIYRGPNVMMGYAQSKADLARGHEMSELHTGDLAERTASGLFRIVGRASRFAKIFGVRISLDDVEELLREAGVSGVAAGDDAGLVVAITDPARVAEISASLAERLELPPTRIWVTAVADAPRLANGKIDYAAVLALRPRTRPAESKGLRNRLAEVLQVPEISEDDTFISLGGDSLTYVEASLLIEEHLGYAPRGWERTPIGELLNLPPRRKRRALIETTVLLRALSIIIVLVSHVSGDPIGGGATTLLMVSGINFFRFNVPRLEEKQSLRVLLMNMTKYGLPYFIALTAFFIILGRVFYPQYLLVSSFTDGFIYNGERRFKIYWFMELYLLLTIIFCALYAVPWVRRISSRHRKGFTLGLLAASVAAGALADRHPEVTLLSPHTPLALGYLFVFGWWVEQLRTPAERILAAVTGTALVILLRPDNTLISIPLLCGSIWLATFWRQVQVGRTLARAVSTLAGGSLYIYIYHSFVLHFMDHFFGTSLTPWNLALRLVLSIATGLGLWWAVEDATRRGKTFLRRRRAPAPSELQTSSP